jgi:glycosyltransferase involved in cell wall biosynthesis
MVLCLNSAKAKISMEDTGVSDAVKIVMMTELFWPYSLGGGEKQFFELAKNLAKKHEVHVYTIKLPEMPKEEIFEGIHIHRVGFLKHPMERRSLLPLPFYMMALFLTKLPKDVDLIHCNSYFPCLAGFVRARARKKPITAVIHDIYRGTWGMALRNKLMGPIGDFLEEIVCKLPYDRIITVSSATKMTLMRTFNIKEEMIAVCGSGIDVKLIDSVKSKKVKNRIVYVGRLVPHKHVDDLIHAVKRVLASVPNVECKIVGGGVLKENLEHMIKKFDLSANVELVGDLPSYEEVISLIKSSEILVLPSTREGFGLVVLEAMRCKTVPVVYELPSYKDFSTDREVLVVPRRNVKALSDSIRKLLQNSRKLSKMAESGFSVSGKYSWEKFSIKIEKIFTQLVDRK